MSKWFAAAALSVLAWPALPVQAFAGPHIYSYNPVSPAARTLTDTGLSFEFEKGLLGAVRIEKVIQTGERGSADLKPASENELGPGGLRAALDGKRPAGGLYEILPVADGKAFVQAVCPGASRAWLLIGPLKPFHNLTIQAVGRDSGKASARPCSEMEFSYYSEWRLPERGAPAVRLGVGGGRG